MGPILALIAPYMRYILLAIGVYILGWLLRRALRSFLQTLISSSSSLPKKEKEHKNQESPTEDIIEICPQCGRVKSEVKNCDQC